MTVSLHEMPGFLHRLKAPVLQELFCRDSNGRSEILPFIQSSSRSLKLLVLMNCSVNFELIIILWGLPSLAHLIIQDDGNYSKSSALFDALASDLCPNLASLVYGYAFVFAEDDFFAMARSRFQLEPPKAYFTQHLFRGRGLRESDEIALSIRMMRDEGFGVSFLDPRKAEYLMKGNRNFFS
jgi:hypothetical protein